MTPLKERFEAKYVHDPASGCWLWIGAKKPRGYGNIGIEGKTKIAHRVSWELFRGPIPADLVVMHGCDNPSCVNPDHLSLGTIADNAKDAARKNRTASAENGRHTWAKLSEAQVLEIRYSLSRVTDLAGKFGVSHTHVSSIRNDHRRTRKLDEHGCRARTVGNEN